MYSVEVIDVEELSSAGVSGSSSAASLSDAGSGSTEGADSSPNVSPTKSAMAEYQTLPDQIEDGHIANAVTSAR